MATVWVVTTQPAAALKIQGPDEYDTRHGDIVTIFVTAHGARFARVVEPSGFVYWLQEREQRTGS